MRFSIIFHLHCPFECHCHYLEFFFRPSQKNIPFQSDLTNEITTTREFSFGTFFRLWSAITFHSTMKNWLNFDTFSLDYNFWISNFLSRIFQKMATVVRGVIRTSVRTQLKLSEMQEQCFARKIASRCGVERPSSVPRRATFAKM